MEMEWNGNGMENDFLQPFIPSHPLERLKIIRPPVSELETISTIYLWD